MLYLYNILTYIVLFALKVVALFNSKLALFVGGRTQSFDIIRQHILPTDNVFWVHVASLGEYEQGLPLIERLKEQYPQHKIVLTFFSPSGYEVKKDSSIADATLYLPMDTFSNAKQFLKLVHPEKTFFIKYEYWPIYLHQLKKQNIPTYLVSGILRPNQIFFKWYGGFYRRALHSFTYFFVQNEISQQLLQQLGYQNIEIVGDTRFDRVSRIVAQNNTLDFLEDFTHQKQYPTLVVGSSWPDDEKFLAEYINTQLPQNTKVIIAPHNIKQDQILTLKNSIQKSTILYSQLAGHTIQNYDVLIIDAYSLLTKAYSYATVAYIGGGFGSGIHNILEAATFGVPIIIGPNFKKFQEAKDLIQLGGCFVISNQSELNEKLNAFLLNPELQEKTGNISRKFILNNQNAVKKIIVKL